MRKWFIGVLFLLSAVAHALIREIPYQSHYEKVVYSFFDVSKNRSGIVTHERIGNKTYVSSGTTITLTTIHGDNEKETTTHVAGDNTVTKITFPKSIFSLADKEEMQGEYEVILKATKEVLESAPVKVTRDDVLFDMIQFTYEIEIGGNLQVKVEGYAPGRLLPKEILFLTFLQGSQQPISRIELTQNK